MFYVYCLRNSQSKDLYYGYTGNLKRRMKEHKQKDKNNNIVYYEAYKSKMDAQTREKKLKNYGQSRTHLKKRIKNSLL